MSHSQSFDAILLKTYDVGEADRFCILFTREKGRLMARAAGARRTGSRLGGSLLPFRRLSMQLKESSAGWIVSGAVQSNASLALSLPAFAALEEGIEILLKLVQHEGELPEVFDATSAFLDACRADVPYASLSYSFCLLHQLGLLPEEAELTAMFGLEAADHVYLRACRNGDFSPQGSALSARVTRPDPSATLRAGRPLLISVQMHFLSLTLSSPLKAPVVTGAMS